MCGIGVEEGAVVFCVRCHNAEGVVYGVLDAEVSEVGVRTFVEYAVQFVSVAETQDDNGGVLGAYLETVTKSSQQKQSLRSWVSPLTAASVQGFFGQI